MFRYPGNSQIVIGVAVSGVLSLLAMAPAVADPTLHYGPAEPWVTAEAPAKPDAAYEGAPGQILLQNTQLRFAPDGATSYYSEFAMRIQTAAGLQYAQAYVTWNPETDVATVNKVHILRDGQVIDVLGKGQTFTTLRREKNLDKAMLDGYLTGVMQPEGLQVGDTLVVGTSIRRLDPVLGGKAEAILSNLSNAPSAKQVVRATWDRSSAPQWRQSDDLKGRVVRNGAEETFVLQREKVVKIETQDNAPARFNDKGFVEFSQFRNWNEVSSLLAPLYAKASALSPDSPLHKEIATIRAASNDPKVQAAMALKLVQTQVRYVFLGMNLGGYTPAAADVTWQRRFGDCKGKTVVLLSILRELGIKAEAATVNAYGGDGLDQALPTLEAFNHVIVRAEIAGQTYWLDGTRLGDRDLDTLQPPFVRWALPLTAAGATLEAVPMLPPQKPTEESFMRLDASAGLDVPAKARIERRLRGDDAVQFDAALNTLPAGEREKALKSWWSEQYDWIEPRKVSATFDPVTGEERLTMDGPASMEWTLSSDGQTWRYETDILRVGWSRGIDRSSGPYRNAPVNIHFPYYTVTREEIILPKGGKDFSADGGTLEKTLGGTEFKRQVSLKHGVLTLDASRRALVPEISYKDAKAAEPVLTSLWEDHVYLVAPKSYRKDTASKVKASAAGEAGKTADELVTDGLERIGQNRMDEALTLFNKALRQDPNHVMALIARAGIFSERRNFRAALADLDLALKVDPTQWIAYNGVGLVHMEQQKPDEAIAAFTRSLDIYPNNVDAYEQRARAYMTLHELDKARQDADAAGELDGDSVSVVTLRADIAMLEHRREDAKAIIRKAIATNSDDMSLRIGLAQAMSDCTGLDAKACDATNAEAVAEYDAMIAREPENATYYAMRAQVWPDADRKKALEDADNAIRLEDGEAWILRVKAQLLISDKAYDKALTVVEQAAVLAPKDLETRDMRAEINFKLGRKEQALAEYDAIKRENPRDAMSFNLSCWGRATNNVELETALADCETALTLSPKSAQTLDSRGLVKLRLGRFDEAIADYDAALKLAPYIAASLYGRGLAKLRKGDKAGGQADLTAARKTWHKIDEDFTDYGLKP